jgi:hypothetical protein
VLSNLTNRASDSRSTPSLAHPSARSSSPQIKVTIDWGHFQAIFSPTNDGRPAEFDW